MSGSEVFPSEEAVVEVIKADSLKRLRESGKRPKPAEAVKNPLDRLFSVARGNNGLLTVHDAAEWPDTAAAVVRVCCGLNEFREFFFPRAATDDDGHVWDFQIEGTWQITNPERFLESHPLKPLERAMSCAGVKAGLIESWLTWQSANGIKMEFDRYAGQKLVHDGALGAAFPQDMVNAWANDFGIEVRVHSHSWDSEDAKRAEEVRMREENLRRTNEDNERVLDAQMRQKQLKAAHDEQCWALEANARLTEKERQNQRAVMEIAHQTKLREAERQLNEAKFALERQPLEHERKMAELRHDRDALEQARARLNEFEQRQECALERLAAAQELLDKLVGQGKEYLAALASPKRDKAFQAAEHLASQKCAVPLDVLYNMGFPVTFHAFVDFLKRRERDEGGPVALTMERLQARNVDACPMTRAAGRCKGTVQVLSLGLNESLRFSFSSRRGGYATILNLGTSGDVFLHAPNPYVHVEDCQVEPCRDYAVPGPELLPLECLAENRLRYAEIGPVGWEHMAVIVSDEPLVSPGVLRRGAPGAPIIELREDEVIALFDKLDSHPDMWSAGVLSFEVLE